MIKEACPIAIKRSLLTNLKKNTLVILTPGFPASEADTTCLPLQQNFVKKLKELYPQLNIIVLSFQYPFTNTTYKWFGIMVIPFDGQNKGGFSRLLLRWPVNNILKMIKKENNIVGLLSFWYGECALVGHRFASNHQLKHYCWLLGQDARMTNKYPKAVHAPTEELVALSDFLQDEFERNHHIWPQHLIPAGIDPGEFKEPPGQKDIDILAAGSLIPLKQYDHFLEIIGSIKKNIPTVKAMLVGAGLEKERLENLITKYDLRDNVILTGELSRPELLKLMQRTKLFLHTSSYEGFSGVCLEALAAGAQVISYCRPMNREIDHWHIVPDKNIMKQKAIELLENSEAIYTPVSPFLIQDTVRSFAGLFDLPQHA